MKESQCVLAYTSLYVDPDGTVRPCCISKDFDDKLNFSDYDTIDEVFNSPQMVALRKDMDEGKKPSICDVCFKRGNQLKDNWNTMWGHKLSDKTLINDDYTVNRLEYLDIRFSNLCNFKCRMCGPSLSSSWYDDIVEIYGDGAKDMFKKFVTIGKDPVDKFTDEDLQYIQHLYLAGGEPFINEDTFKLLDRFSDEHASKINMYINTNLSTLKFKGRDVLDTLSRFGTVTIGSSCDGYGEVGEYQRTGFNSDKFFENLKKVKDYNKIKSNLHSEIEYTITLMNVFHIFDFVDYVVGNGYLEQDKIHFHWATTPYYYAVGASPDDFKQKVYEYLDEHLGSGKYHEEIVKVLNGFKDYVKIDRNIIMEGEKRHDLKEYVEKIDKMRNNSYKDICPWIEMMF